MAHTNSGQLDAEEVIRTVLERGGSPCITCSFQANGMALLDLLRKQVPDIPVIFIDTGYHFAETYAYRDRIVRAWDLNLINVTPELSVAEQEAKYGKLYSEVPDYCCEMRKVEPLARALQPYDIWFTGLRRGDSPTRAGIAQIENHTLASGKTMRKVEPAGFLDFEGRVGLSHRERDRASAALRSRLHQHRLPALHETAYRSREPAFRPLGRPEAGMRHPLLRPRRRRNLSARFESVY